MARLARDVNRTKPWKAEVRIDGVPTFIGYFDSHMEAAQAEVDLRASYPDGRVQRG